MPLLQLQPHYFSSLPAHPSLAASESRPELHSYISTGLHEALEFLHSIPSSFTADPKLRSSIPSEASVKLLRWRKPLETGTGGEEKSEFWVCRQSEHVDSATKGTASWSEFESGLRCNHAEHEMDYTPSVTGIEKLLEWTRSEVGELEVNGIQFKDIDVEVNLITHTFHPSAIISPRSFISLTISAAYTCESIPGGFLTVQIPILSNPSSNPSLHEKIQTLTPRRTIFANYASVERVTLLPSPQAKPDIAENPRRRIEWTMATTSDAGGSIPKWVQRNWTLGGVPRAVVADVGLFIGWTMRRREAV